MEWHPIKTVPKNTYVLICAENSGHPTVMSRMTKSQTKLTTGRFWGWEHTGAVWTHWMPIPEPLGGERDDYYGTQEWAEEFRDWLDAYDFERRYKETRKSL